MEYMYPIVLHSIVLQKWKDKLLHCENAYMVLEMETHDLSSLILSNFEGDCVCVCVCACGMIIYVCIIRHVLELVKLTY